MTSRKWTNSALMIGLLASVFISLMTLFRILYSSDSDFDLRHMLVSTKYGDGSYGYGAQFHPHGPHHFRNKDFRPNQRHRYESFDVWRTPDTFRDTYPPAPRPPSPHAGEFNSLGRYLQQPLPADYAPGSERIFLMIKTGADVLWKRLPVHLFTTLSRVPNFALYSDKPGSVGGYEVIDVLENVTKATYESSDFEKYRRMKSLYAEYMTDPSNIKIKGGWELDKFKNIPMLAHAYRMSPQSDWFVFQDADSYMFIDTLTAWLNKLDPNKPLYMGSGAMLGDLLFAHGGSCVVLSRKALELTIGAHPEYVQEYEKKAFDTCCGDALVAEMLRDKLKLELSYGKDTYPNVWSRFQGKPHWQLDIGKDEWCSPLVSFHHVTAHDIEVLWEYEKLRGPDRSKLTWSDIYLDFFQPYITDRMEHWDNGASDVVFVKEKGPDTDGANTWPYDEKNPPWSSVENCRETCLGQNDCLSWRYIPGKNYCGFAFKVLFGSPTLDFMSEVPDAISGWEISRIRKLRENQKCDPLYKDKTSEGQPDGSTTDYYEGWYKRRLLANSTAV